MQGQTIEKMVTQTFINLPVADLKRSQEFFTRIGFVINKQFTDDTAACVVFSNTIYAMLLTKEKFKSFVPKNIADSQNSSEVLVALSVDNNDIVNRIADAALAAGGSEAQGAKDFGFMYSRAFYDLDGHAWEVFHMDMSKFPQQ